MFCLGFVKDPPWSRETRWPQHHAPAPVPFPKALPPGVLPGSLSFLPERPGLVQEGSQSVIPIWFCPMAAMPWNTTLCSSLLLPLAPPQGHFPCDLPALGSRVIPTLAGARASPLSLPLSLLCPSHSPEGKQVRHQAPQLINSPAFTGNSTPKGRSTEL
jgi:hypothetical protein